MACNHCGVEMTPHYTLGSKVHYFQCSSCLRWVSSTYADVLRGDAKFSAIPLQEKSSAEREFSSVKERLEKWLATLDQSDPFQILGIRPHQPMEEIKARFRALALANHPDRGGSTETMRQLNDAYERVLAQRAKSPESQLLTQRRDDPAGSKQATTHPTAQVRRRFVAR